MCWEIGITKRLVQNPVHVLGDLNNKTSRTESSTCVHVYYYVRGDRNNKTPSTESSTCAWRLEPLCSKYCSLTHIHVQCTFKCTGISMVYLNRPDNNKVKQTPSEWEKRSLKFIVIITGKLEIVDLLHRLKNVLSHFLCMKWIECYTWNRYSGCSVHYLAPAMEILHPCHSYRDHNRGAARSEAPCFTLHFRFPGIIPFEDHGYCQASFIY